MDIDIMFEPKRKLALGVHQALGGPKQSWPESKKSWECLGGQGGGPVQQFFWGNVLVKPTFVLEKMMCCALFGFGNWPARQDALTDAKHSEQTSLRQTKVHQGTSPCALYFLLKRNKNISEIQLALNCLSIDKHHERVMRWCKWREISVVWRQSLSEVVTVLEQLFTAWRNLSDLVKQGRNKRFWCEDRCKQRRVSVVCAKGLVKGLLQHVWPEVIQNGFASMWTWVRSFVCFPCPPVNSSQKIEKTLKWWRLSGLMSLGVHGVMWSLSLRYAVSSRCQHSLSFCLTRQGQRRCLNVAPSLKVGNPSCYPRIIRQVIHFQVFRGPEVRFLTHGWMNFSQESLFLLVFFLENNFFTKKDFLFWVPPTSQRIQGILPQWEPGHCPSSSRARPGGSPTSWSTSQLAGAVGGLSLVWTIRKLI